MQHVSMFQYMIKCMLSKSQNRKFSIHILKHETLIKLSLSFPPFATHQWLSCINNYLKHVVSSLVRIFTSIFSGQCQGYLQLSFPKAFTQPLGGLQAVKTWGLLWAISSSMPFACVFLVLISFGDCVFLHVDFPLLVIESILNLHKSGSFHALSLIYLPLLLPVVPS